MKRWGSACIPGQDTGGWEARSFAAEPLARLCGQELSSVTLPIQGVRTGMLSGPYPGLVFETTMGLRYEVLERSVTGPDPGCSEMVQA